MAIPLTHHTARAVPKSGGLLWSIMNVVFFFSNLLFLFFQKKKFLNKSFFLNTNIFLLKKRSFSVKIFIILFKRIGFVEICSKIWRHHPFWFFKFSWKTLNLLLSITCEIFKKIPFNFYFCFFIFAFKQIIKEIGIH